MLRSYRKQGARGISTTRSGTLLKKQIPIRTFQDWNEAKPGFLEADLVAHCGTQLPIPARESPCDSSMGMKRALLVRGIGWGIAGFPSPPQKRWI